MKNPPRTNLAANIAANIANVQQQRSRSGSFNNHIVTEWEDNILFDVDDPDFCNLTTNVVSVLNSQATTAANAAAAAAAAAAVNATTMHHATLNGLHMKVPTTMSLASVHGPQFTDICSPLGRSSISMSSSISDLVGSPLEISMDNVLTIEELRQHMGSCFTCGVSWTDDHVSLDCSECGGYSLERPCPLCDGHCGVLWKRDFTMSHACSKARWHGVCPSYPEVAAQLTQNVGGAGALSNANTTTAAAAQSCAATQMRLAQELCARLEQLSASSSAATARY